MRQRAGDLASGYGGAQRRTRYGISYPEHDDCGEGAGGGINGAVPCFVGGVIMLT